MRAKTGSYSQFSGLGLTLDRLSEQFNHPLIKIEMPIKASPQI
ncbi:hypothetical protein MYAER_3042 [Microcystis aeruginosa NIES-2549]|uniref:Uncharacterized protein n=1 Tax=Microcystis aeruginosa NIES-2549 TaxID=1641812 RepID=A0A0F6U5N0_MICAE|nr:hypothetical protein MYAER_3042 [Microcystis aeruginosa NIES-2549]AOC53792.1 hypothetical protein amyaer_3085 [Microcystis aeruginosa NIES-2481]